MKRRAYLKTMLSTASGAMVLGVGAEALHAAAPAKGSIQLFLDLSVDPKKEQIMLKSYRESFRPTASKQPGFIDTQMMKLRSAIQGSAPAGTNYRFMISFTSEDARLKWVSTADHQRVWPEIEKNLTTKNYSVLLYDLM